MTQTEHQKRPGLARRAAVGAGKAWAYSLGLTGLSEELRRLAGGVAAAGRYVRHTLMERPQNRTETFQDAVDRLGLTEADLIRQAQAFNRRANAWFAAMLLAAVWLAVYLPHAERPLSFALTCAGLTGMTFAKFITWRFRLCQVRDQELYSFGPWLFTPRYW